MHADLDGLLTFMASHHAIRADSTLQKSGLHSRLIPGPKDLSPNCGTAVRFSIAQWTDVDAALAAAHVQVDEIHRWKPRTDAWSRPARET